jgi:hypothetical protein
MFPRNMPHPSSDFLNVSNSSNNALEAGGKWIGCLALFSLEWSGTEPTVTEASTGLLYQPQMVMDGRSWWQVNRVPCFVFL